MGASGAGGVVDAKLVGMEEQSRRITNLQRFLLLAQAELLVRNRVDQSVADGGGQSLVLILCLVGLVLVDVAVLCTFTVVFILSGVLVSQEGSSAMARWSREDQTNLLLGNLVVPFLNEVLDILDPFPESGAGHL